MRISIRLTSSESVHFRPTLGFVAIRTSTRNLLLGVGPGVSCRLVGPLAAQLEMVLGGYLSTNLPFPPGMVGNASPGVRYRFGGE